MFFSLFLICSEIAESSPYFGDPVGMLAKFWNSNICRIIACRLASIVPLNSNKQWNNVISTTFQNVTRNC